MKFMLFQLRSLSVFSERSLVLGAIMVLLSGCQQSSSARDARRLKEQNPLASLKAGSRSTELDPKEKSTLAATAAAILEDVPANDQETELERSGELPLLGAETLDPFEGVKSSIATAADLPEEERGQASHDSAGLEGASSSDKVAGGGGQEEQEESSPLPDAVLEAPAAPEVPEYDPVNRGSSESSDSEAPSQIATANDADDVVTSGSASPVELSAASLMGLSSTAENRGLAQGEGENAAEAKQETAPSSPAAALLEISTKELLSADEIFPEEPERIVAELNQQLKMMDLEIDSSLVTHLCRKEFPPVEEKIHPSQHNKSDQDECKLTHEITLKKSRELIEGCVTGVKLQHRIQRLSAKKGGGMRDVTRTLLQRKWQKLEKTHKKTQRASKKLQKLLKQKNCMG
jgi:hypothetical protein